MSTLEQATDLGAEQEATSATPSSEAGVDSSPPTLDAIRAQLDSDVATLAGQKDVWAQLPLTEKFHHIMEMRRKLGEVADRWVKLAAEAKGLSADSPLLGEEWATGPWVMAHGLNRYADTFQTLEHGEDLLDQVGDVRTRPDGQVVVDVAPINRYESLFLNGVRAELWMEPDITAENLRGNMAKFYREPNPQGKVALVLGAGNVASIGPMDALHKLFAEGQVVLLKLNPVNDYLRPIWEELFESLISYGFMRIVSGDADVGDYLVNSDEIDEIHMTGSAKTHDIIVFGPGEEGAKRKAAGKPRLQKRVTSELGNVSPTIVLPGDWSKEDYRFQAENIVTQKLHNSGFNCIATQVLILPAEWDGTPYLMGEIRRLLRTIPQRMAYYPGAAERTQRFADSHGRAETIGQQADGVSHRVLLTQIDPKQIDATAFQEEAFGTVMAQTSLAGADAESYFRNAIAFANETLHGTLGANVIADPKTMKEMGKGFEELLAEMKYGAIGVNIWIGGAFTLSQTAWGAFPGHSEDDIQSGTGKVHNAFLFDKPQKTIVYGPFRPFPRSILHGEWTILPKPPWFVTNKTSTDTFKKLTEFELNPGIQHLPGVVWSAMRGGFS